MNSSSPAGTVAMRCASAALALTTAAGIAVAEPPATDSPSYVVDAEVVQVSPRYGWHEVSQPVRECTDVPPRATAYGYGGHDPYAAHEYPYRDRHRPGEGAAGLVGGLIGGLIGNQFGGGRGRTALTVAGAMLGASVARDRVRRDRYPGADYPASPSDYRIVRQCTERVQTRRVRDLEGYDVSYRYQGETFHKWMDERPGQTIPVRVSVEPLVDISRR